MAIAEAPAAEVAPAAAPAPGSAPDAATSGPRTPTPSTPSAPAGKTTYERAAAERAAASSNEGAAAPTDQAAPVVERDPYAEVAALDFDEIVKRHPRAGKRLEALATKKAATLQEQRDAETRRVAQERERAETRELWQRWKTERDPEAGTALLDRVGAPIDQELSEEAYADQVRAARDDTRSTIWQEHAKSFGLDPTDDDVSAALQGAKTFKDLNLALVASTRDKETLDAMWAHPEVQKRHEAALSQARAAATINGQASVIGDKRLDVSSSGGGRPQTPDEVIAEYAEASRHGRPSKELTDSYRRVTGRLPR